MKAQSLWSNLQGIPDPLFDFQGVASERLVREVQSAWRSMEVRVGLARSKRDSRTTQRISSKGFQRS